MSHRKDLLLVIEVALNYLQEEAAMLAKRLNTAQWTVGRLHTYDAVVVDSPTLSANTVMHIEEHARVVLRLDLLEPGVVVAPERLLPVGLRDISLVSVRATIGSDIAKRAYGLGGEF